LLAADGLLGQEDDYRLLRAWWTADIVLSTFQIYKAICEISIIIHIIRSRKGLRSLNNLPKVTQAGKINF
jgi:hypothetical protein